MGGLTDTQFWTTLANLASIIGSMVGDTLQYAKDEKRDLVQQFEVYILAFEWKMENVMTAPAGTSLLTTAKLVSDVNSVGMISPAIKLTKQNIAQFTVTVRRRKLYLAMPTTFDELHDYRARNPVSNQLRCDAVSMG